MRADVFADPRAPRRELSTDMAVKGKYAVPAQSWSLRGSGELPFLHVLPTLVEDLLDIIGWSYDGIDYVVLYDVHEAILDPGKSDHPLAAVGVVAQTPRDVAANFYLHTRWLRSMSP